MDSILVIYASMLQLQTIQSQNTNVFSTFQYIIFSYFSVLSVDILPNNFLSNTLPKRARCDAYVFNFVTYHKSVLAISCNLEIVLSIPCIILTTIHVMGPAYSDLMCFSHCHCAHIHLLLSLSFLI